MIQFVSAMYSIEGKVNMYTKLTLNWHVYYIKFLKYHTLCETLTNLEMSYAACYLKLTC